MESVLHLEFVVLVFLSIFIAFAELITILYGIDHIFRLFTGSSASPPARQSHQAANSPRPELTTMTNVNVLDLQMNSQPPSLQQSSGLSRESDEDTKKNSRSESYDDNDSIW